ncbi:hypothetical protein [Streptomyces laurentii]|uniref:hypothetical protein n=1 Tax=Streptomyces laurentii TaxID=39478 RepID=UPI0036C1B79F
MTPTALRALALGLVVPVAVLVPVMATAGPAAEPAPAAVAEGMPAAPEPVHPAPVSPAPVLLSLVSVLPSPGSPTAARLSPARLSPARASLASAPPASPSSTVTRCGPELSSPDGVEAQTCVVSEAAGIRARTYYRNATGRELDAVLTFLAPAGRTVQVRCAIEARDEPGTCQTPMEPPRESAGTGFSAVAEFAGSGEGDSTPLLLRSGSNSVETEGS